MANLGRQRSILRRIEALEARLGAEDPGPTPPEWEVSDEEALEIARTLAEVGVLEELLVGEGSLSAEEAREFSEQLLAENPPDGGL